MSAIAIHKKVTLLDRTRHSGLKVQSINFDFAATQQSCPIAGIEFVQCAADHPIVFVTDKNDQIFPVALFSLSPGQNDHVGSDGSWDQTYIPLFFRQYPFILSDDGAVCIDEESDAFSRDIGERLFAGEKNAPKLDEAISFLTQFKIAADQTESVCEKLIGLDLFKPCSFQIAHEAIDPVTVNGFSVIDDDKITKVRWTILESPNSKVVSWVYAHLVSLEHFKKLGNRLAMSVKTKAAE